MPGLEDLKLDSFHAGFDAKKSSTFQASLEGRCVLLMVFKGTSRVKTRGYFGFFMVFEMLNVFWKVLMVFAHGFLNGSTINSRNGF